MKKSLFILFAFVFTSSFGQQSFHETLSNDLERKFIDGETVFLSIMDNSVVAIISPKVEGKRGLMNIEIQNKSKEIVHFQNPDNIEIKILKNGKVKEYTKPTSSSDLVKKIRSNFQAGEIVGGFSRGYSNSLSGNKQLNYQNRSTGTISTTKGTSLYSTTEQGTISYYDQSEVNKRNQQDQYQMKQRVTSFNEKLAEFEDSLLKSNSLNSEDHVSGDVYFSIKGRNPEVLTVLIKVGKDVHEFKLK